MAIQSRALELSVNAGNLNRIVYFLDDVRRLLHVASTADEPIRCRDYLTRRIVGDQCDVLGQSAGGTPTSWSSSARWQLTERPGMSWRRTGVSVLQMSMAYEQRG